MSIPGEQGYFLACLAFFNECPKQEYLRKKEENKDAL